MNQLEAHFIANGGSRNGPIGEQSTPTKSDRSVPVYPLIWRIFNTAPNHRAAGYFHSILLRQREKGLAKYKTELHTFNGRSALRDFEEEIVDALQYGIQAMLEDPTQATKILDVVTCLQIQLTKGATLVGQKD